MASVKRRNYNNADSQAADGYIDRYRLALSARYATLVMFAESLTGSNRYFSIRNAIYVLGGLI